MGWETRAGNQYYYRKVRAGGRVISQYVGTGELAGLVAQLNEIDQQRRKFERDVRQAEQADIAALDSQVDEFCAVVGQIVKAVLLATGHHQHKRQWRKRRMAKEEWSEELSAALGRVQKDKPTKTDKALITKFIQETPGGWMVYGDLYRNAIASTIKMMTGNKSSGWLLGVSLEKRLDNLKADFGYNTGSPIERLLIEQICLCWLKLYWLENIFSQNYDKISLANTLLYEKRLTLSQHRFNRAIETLAKVRRLASRTPEILAINIAQQQQVNVTG